MTLQPDITPFKRGVLLNWMVEVSSEFTLSTEALYLSKFIVDRTLERQGINQGQLQLLGIVALFIASKFEDDTHTPPVNEFAIISDGTYQVNQVIAPFLLYFHY